MNETKKSLTIGAVAVALALLAFLTAPRTATPEAFLDQGEPFFPDFDNPNEAASLEVVDFDDETAAAKPFKVVNDNGRWTIPSHHDYPADGEDRLAETAAGVIGITKDDFRSDNASDHEACGVVDPLDDAATSLKGRGKRVTIRGQNDLVLADFILGKEIEGREGMRFVRVPGQKRVYAAKVDVEISTKFEDWIEKDLLEADRGSIDEVILKDYSIDEVTYRVDERDTIRLEKDGEEWKAERMPAGQEVDMTKMNDLLDALDELSIVGVRPKPQGLSQSLKKDETGFSISQADMLSLQDKGYFFARDGSLLSNEGEVQVRTSDGIAYTLRFGEVLYGRGEVVTAGTGGAGEEEEQGPGENRYLFVTASFLPGLFEEPPVPSDTSFQSKAETDWTDEDRKNKGLFDAHEEWKAKIERGEKLARDLNTRFADWYYVISADSFEKVDLGGADLFKAKEDDEA